MAKIGHAARKALPSESFGKVQATTLSVCSWAWILFHIGMKASHRSLTPRKYIDANLGLNVLLPGVGLPPRLAYQACQGTLPQITGVPRVSALVATGLTVSGVEEVSSRSTLSDRMAWLARSPARLGSDWVS